MSMLELHENQYDLIASLGANCSATHNLIVRGLRKAALPFDWTYVIDERPYLWMAEHVCDRFRDFCKRENLVEITPDSPEWSDYHYDRVQYVDSGSGFRFVNHFSRQIDCDGEYDKVHSTLVRRIERFFEMIGKSKKVLFVVATPILISPETFSTLHRSFSASFPNVDFSFAYMRFSIPKDETLPSYGAETRFIPIERSQNSYDFTHTNFEWNFMGSLELSGLFVPKEAAPKKNDRLIHISFDIWPTTTIRIEVRKKRKTSLDNQSAR